MQTGLQFLTTGGSRESANCHLQTSCDFKQQAKGEIVKIVINYNKNELYFINFEVSESCYSRRCESQRETERLAGERKLRKAGSYE